MAQIVNRAGRKIFLKRYHIFGRDPLIASTLLTSETCSKLHAAIFFEGNEWYIEDRSVNGLVINNVLVHKKKVPLESVKRLRFSISEKEEWSIEDLTPPCSYLQSWADESILPLEEVMPVIFENKNFSLIRKGNWVLENDEDSFPLSSGQYIFHQGEKYLFVCNECLDDAVLVSKSEPDFNITFELSENYEDVNVFIELCGARTVLLNKSYNFIWYLLAKKVKRDILNDEKPQEIGWIDNEMLLSVLNKECKQNFDVYYLNLQIHRMRKRLISLDDGYDFFFNNLIQRRKGEIRMNTTHIQINEPDYEVYSRVV